MDAPIQTPPFLAHLGLTHEADEREVKRAYARQLKQIDQATDAAGFQRLREAYEASMNWVAWRRHQMAQEAEQALRSDGVASDAEAPSTASNAEVGEVDAARRVEDSSHAAPPTEATDVQPKHDPAAEASTAHAQEQSQEPSAPTPQALASMLFDEHFATPCADEADARTRLDRCLDDPRLIDLEARLIFEWRVAHALAEGFRPGHDALWAAAQALFHWDADHTRLRQFNRVGHVLENAINEQDFFERQDESHRYEQARIMQRLRSDQRPHDSEFARLMPVLEWMLATYPNWMWVATKAENVQAWKEHHRTLPQSLRAIREPTPTSSPAVVHTSGESSSSGKAWWFFIACLIGLTNFFRMVGGDHTPYSSAAADPAHQARLAAQLQQQTKQVVQELDTAMASATAAPMAPASGVRAAKVINPTDLAKLVFGPLSAERCERAAALAQELTGPGSPDPRLGESFDSLVTQCVYNNLWPNRGDPVSKSAMRRDIARAK